MKRFFILTVCRHKLNNPTFIENSDIPDSNQNLANNKEAHGQQHGIWKKRPRKSVGFPKRSKQHSRNDLRNDHPQKDGTPIVTVEHLGNKMFSEQNLPRVSNTDKNRLKKYVLKQGDIVFSRVGSVDRCSYVDQKHDGWMFSGRCLRVRPTSEIDSEYLYYYFCLEETKQFVRNIAVGATMPSINTKLLGEVVVTFPELEQQKRISGILSAIDSKIEVNQKINDNLAA